MKFIEFKNNLEKCGIILFDYDYRICHYNMKVLSSDIFFSIEQNGGGINDDFYIPPFIILKKLENKKKIELLINKLLRNNFVGAKYLCKNGIKLNYF